MSQYPVLMVDKISFNWIKYNAFKLIWINCHIAHNATHGDSEMTWIRAQKRKLIDEKEYKLKQQLKLSDLLNVTSLMSDVNR